MTARAVALLLVGGACLGLASCPSKRATGPDIGQAARGNVDDDPCLIAYQELKPHGLLYAGTVESVIPTGTGGDFMQFIERGEIRFRVARTVIGPPREEKTIPYWWVKEDQGGGGEVLMADWVGRSPWPARPKVGEQLLLLIGDEEHETCQGEYPVIRRWEVDPDDPFVEELAVVARFLATEDRAVQDDLYRQLCESRFRTIRYFALDAAFYYIGLDKHGWGHSCYGEGYDPVRQSHLALVYLKHAASRLTSKERLSVTGSFAHWMEWGRQKEDVTDELKGAFEDWYLVAATRRDWRVVAGGRSTDKPDGPSETG